jgi:hypothetical protein
MFTTTQSGGSQRSSTGRNQHSNPYIFDDLFASFHRSAAGTGWRWRTELAILTTITAALWRLTVLTTLVWASVILAATVAVALAVPHSRRFITRRAWCVQTRHRVQRLCWEARLHTRAGRLPLVLWTRPTKVGERSHVLCRAGICAEDFERHIGELRAACGARDARVTRNLRWSQFVTIDIIRRDTLAATQTVGSPLQRLTAHDQPGEPSIPRPPVPDQPSLTR